MRRLIYQTKSWDRDETFHFQDWDVFETFKIANNRKQLTEASHQNYLTAYEYIHMAEISLRYHTQMFIAVVVVFIITFRLRPTVGKNG